MSKEVMDNIVALLKKNNAPKEQYIFLPTKQMRMFASYFKTLGSSSVVYLKEEPVFGTLVYGGFTLHLVDLDELTPIDQIIQK